MLLRPVLGEKLDALLLASARVAPRRLERDGYPFRHPELEDALRALLGRG
jgi:NAD dependent epimerase/dehydratase family enzyme